MRLTPSTANVTGCQCRRSPSSNRIIAGRPHAWPTLRCGRKRPQVGCGSVFKNPPGDHAARLVEAAGAKALSVGGASVSEKHANFIVARSGATAEDVHRLIGMVHDAVEQRFGVNLETEVQRVGDFDLASR